MVTSTPNGAGDPTPAEKLLTREEAAERLRIHLRTVQRLIVSKELPAVRIGRHVRIDPADLAAFIERKKTWPGPGNPKHPTERNPPWQAFPVTAAARSG
jgi:excisionase family DNA binding protein